MRLLAVYPGEGEPPGFDLLLGWMAASGHEVRALTAAALDPGFARHAGRLIDEFAPDLVIGAGPAGWVALGLARGCDLATVLIAHDTGTPPDMFVVVDRVLVPSGWLAARLRASGGVVAEMLPWPVAPVDADDTREFLTVVDPTPERGAALFARLAELLARGRPDIPILVVPSGPDVVTPLLSEAARAQIVASPALPLADILALTRVLVLPLLVEDAAAYVAATAMVSGVPVLASDRGALLEIIGLGGLAVPLPAIVLTDPHAMPGEAETRHWADAAARLWDEHVAYGTAGRAHAAREQAGLRDRYETFWLESR